MILITAVDKLKHFTCHFFNLYGLQKHSLWLACLSPTTHKLGKLSSVLNDSNTKDNCDERSHGTADRRENMACHVKFHARTESLPLGVRTHYKQLLAHILRQSLHRPL